MLIEGVRLEPGHWSPSYFPLPLDAACLIVDDLRPCGVAEVLTASIVPVYEEMEKHTKSENWNKILKCAKKCY